MWRVPYCFKSYLFSNVWQHTITTGFSALRGVVFVYPIFSRSWSASFSCSLQHKYHIPATRRSTCCGINVSSLEYSYFWLTGRTHIVVSSLNWQVSRELYIHVPSSVGPPEYIQPKYTRHSERSNFVDDFRRCHRLRMPLNRIHGYELERRDAYTRSFDVLNSGPFIERPRIPMQVICILRLLTFLVVWFFSVTMVRF